MYKIFHEVAIHFPIQEKNCQLSCIIFTSGTTKNAKAVKITKSNLTNLLLNLKDISSKGNILQFASPSFDACLFEILLYTTNSNSLSIMTDKAKGNTRLFWKTLYETRATFITITPSVLTMYLDALKDKENLRFIKTIFLIGETSPTSLIKRLKKLINPDCRIINGYGTVENTISNSWADISDAYDQENSPIGKVISGVDWLVISDCNSPLPPFMPGELALLGSSLSDGYLTKANSNQPFTNLKFNSSKATKILKTGDLVYYSKRDSLFFLGRKNNHSKLNGQRIYPDEIQSALCNHTNGTQGPTNNTYSLCQMLARR